MINRLVIQLYSTYIELTIQFSVSIHIRPYNNNSVRNKSNFTDTITIYLHPYSDSIRRWNVEPAMHLFGEPATRLDVFFYSLWTDLRNIFINNKAYSDW
jgi:hypothetical protein